MDIKKENLKLLLLYVAIGLIAAGTTAWFLYQNRIEYWKAEASRALRVALMKEIQKRSEIKMYFYSDGNVSLPNDSVDIIKNPIRVTMESEEGKKDFVIPYEKHIHNIERSSDVRLLHSYILGTHPLKADSLDLTWRSLMDEMGFSGKTAVRISKVDWFEHETKVYSDNPLYIAKSDSLTSYHLGYRCEIGVVGYLHYSWWMFFNLKDIILLFSLVFCCILLFFIQEYIIKFCTRFFVKEVTVIVEKEVPIIIAEKNQLLTYRLEDDLHFETDSGKLRKKDTYVKLSPILSKLFNGFLEAKNYKLSVNEIMDLLWPDGSGTSERVHTTIKRLRDSLSSISDWRIEKGNSGYYLKSPHSIEEIMNN